MCANRRGQMALNSAQALKNRGVMIYTIGLGSPNDVDQDFLEEALEQLPKLADFLAGVQNTNERLCVHRANQHRLQAI